MRRGVRFVEHDVSRDRAAASEMVRLSGQTGVPVPAVDGQFVVGFDRPRLEQLLAQTGVREGGAPRVSLGLRVADARSGAGRPGGAYVGSVKTGSPAERAGLREGDVVVQAGGVPIAGAGDLEGALAAHSAGQELTLTALRGGQTLRFRVVLR